MFIVESFENIRTYKHDNEKLFVKRRSLFLYLNIL